MQRDPNKTVSARGEVVDFELLRVKQEIASNAVVAKREPRRGRRRRLSERVTKAVRQDAAQAADKQPDTPTASATPEAVAPPIVVRNKTRKSRDE